MENLLIASIVKSAFYILFIVIIANFLSMIEFPLLVQGIILYFSLVIVVILVEILFKYLGFEI